MTSALGNILNCTPHDVCLYDAEGKNKVHTFARSGTVPRLEQEPQKELGKLTLPNGVAITIVSPQKFKDVEGLPAYESPEKCPDIIVSMLVGQRLQETGKWPGAVYGPDMGKTGEVRSPEGQIIGTKVLIQYCARKVFEQTKPPVEPVLPKFKLVDDRPVAFKPPSEIIQ